MSTPQSPNNDRLNEENPSLRESLRVGNQSNTRSRHKQFIVIGIVLVFALAAILLGFLYLRPKQQVTTEAPAAAASTGTVKFLMEQQWLIRMKLALVEEQTVARQITATGRVIPAANGQALVAPPV